MKGWVRCGMTKKKRIKSWKDERISHLMVGHEEWNEDWRAELEKMKGWVRCMLAKKKRRRKNWVRKAGMAEWERLGCLSEKGWDGWVGTAWMSEWERLGWLSQKGWNDRVRKAGWLCQNGWMRKAGMVEPERLGWLSPKGWFFSSLVGNWRLESKGAGR